MTTDSHRQQHPPSGTPMSVKEYFQLDNLFPNAKYEYQHGKIRLMAGGTVAHDEIAFNIHDIHISMDEIYAGIDFNEPLIK